MSDDLIPLIAAFSALAVAIFGAMRHSRCSRIETPCCVLDREVVNAQNDPPV